MKKKNIKIVKAVSLFMGFIYFGGLIWFGDYYLSKPIYFIFFTLSTGLALIITPLITNNKLKSIPIRMITILLAVIGILNNIYMMIYAFLTSQHLVDIIAGTLQQMIILLVLVIMIRRIVNPQLEEGTQ